MTEGSSTRRGADIVVNLSVHETPPSADIRRRIRDLLANECDECVADTELIATELVSNAYDHGRTPGHLRVRRADGTGIVRIEVEDANRWDLPLIGKSRLGQHRGRGLILVENLAHTWGVHLRDTGKMVWAELTCWTLKAVPGSL